MSALTSISMQQLESMASQLIPPFKMLLEDERIEPTVEIHDLLTGLYLPIADWLVNHHTGSPHFVGINGAQGSGKSTFCRIIALLLSEGFGKRVATLSIDDLYLTHAERKQLSEKVHPLFITRGVPGTHDVALGLHLFQQLQQAHGSIKLPQFDKSVDDRSPESDWPSIDLPVDIILLEGWCVGTQAQTEAELQTPINELERDEDSNGQWRQYVNQQLIHSYPALFDQLDTLVMLEIPDLGKVMEWRSLQEQKLRDKRGDNHGVMDGAAIKRFIMHYERLTLANLATLPQRANLLLKLDDNHQISEIMTRNIS